MSRKKKKPTDWESLIRTGQFEASDFPMPDPPPPKRPDLPKERSGYLRNFLDELTDQDPIDSEVRD
jgi:hypothetical protein